MCNSTNCCHVTIGDSSAIVCFGDGVERLLDGVRFEFSERWGPTFINKNGRESKRHPPYKSAWWSHLQAWCKQGHRVAEDGITCVYDRPSQSLYVRLGGRQWAHVPDGQSPEDVRREYFALIDREPPETPCETMEVDE